MSFNEIRGQDRAIALLRRAVARGTVASGYLFSGPEGVGKARCALALAQALECEARQPGEGEGCGVCAPCRKVEAKTHPDLHWLVPDGAFIKIDQIRELKAKLSLRAHEGLMKVAVLEGAEKLHPTAANALLKTLEEPTADTRFVLLAKSPRFVLPTIRSRCQAVPFVPLSAELVEAVLLEQGADPEAARVAARLSEGSVGRARAALDASEELRQRLDMSRRIEGAVSSPDPLLGLRAAEELAKGLDRQEAMAVLELFALFYRDVVCAASRASELCAFADPQEPESRDGERVLARARELGVRRALACLEAIQAARDALSRNANAQLVAEDLVFSLRRHSGVTRRAVSR